MNKLTNITPFDECELAIEDLFEEAKTWLDGESVTKQDQADMIGKLLVKMRKAGNALESEFKTEKRPILDAGVALADRYKPGRGKVKQVTDVCKQAMTPFLQAQEAAKREVERVAREQAEAAERAAQAAMQSTTIGDIEERAEGEAMLEAAKKQTAAANRASKDKGQAQTGGKAIGLKTTYRPKLVDLSAAIKYYWALDKAMFETLVLEQAARDVRAGKHELPGFEIIETKEAV